jgi:septum formation protein
MITILATASKARRKLMKICKKNVLFAKAELDETRFSNEDIYDYLQRITYLKAYKFLRKNRRVISADTVISFNDSIIGKPKDKSEAFEILSLLRGKKHYCKSGVTIIAQDYYEFFVDSAVVYMNYLSDRDIYKYLDNEDFASKAAGYAIQGRARHFMRIVKGDITTVIGLPMKKLCRII